MADQQNNPNNQDPHSDFEVFRVPPREMLDKYSNAPQDLPPVNSTGGTDQTKKNDFGLGKSELFDKPISNQNAAPQVVSTASPSVQAPAPNQPVASEPKTAESSEDQVRDIFAQPAKKETSVNPPVPPQNIETELTPGNQPSKMPGKPRNLKWLWVLLIFILVLPIILIALEWFGLFSIGLSKIIGSPPAKLTWSRTQINFENFNAVLGGSINLEQALLSSDTQSWVEQNGYDQKTNVNFSGSVIKSANVVSGVWVFESDPGINFRFEAKKLYLQRSDGKWYQIETGINNIDVYFQTMQNYFTNASNFQAIKPTADNVFSYKATIQADNLGIKDYVASGAAIIIDFDNKNFKLKRISLNALPLSGIDIELNLTDFNNEIVELQSLNKKNVLEGAKEFPPVYYLLKLLTRDDQDAETATSLDVSPAEQEKNDIQRKTDLKKIAGLLTKYKIDHENYPIAEEMIKIEADQDFINKLTPYLEVGQSWDFRDPEWPNKYYGYQSEKGETYRLSAVLQNTNDSEAPLDPISKLNLYIITDKINLSEN